MEGACFNQFLYTGVLIFRTDEGTSLGHPLHYLNPAGLGEALLPGSRRVHHALRGRPQTHPQGPGGLERAACPESPGRAPARGRGGQAAGQEGEGKRRTQGTEVVAT